MKESLKKFRQIIPKNYPFRNKGLRNLPKEKWKPVPGFEETHEISNYGRVKALERFIEAPNQAPYYKKEMILSSTVFKSPNSHKRDFTYHLGVGIRVNNRRKVFPIRRLVYHCFVEPFDLRDSGYFIIPKDGNGYNVFYKNLSKISIQDLRKKTLSEERSINPFIFMDRKKLAQKGIPKRAAKLRKPVTQYDLRGHRITVYSSIKEAAIKTGTSATAISSCVHGKLNAANEFIWRLGEGRKKNQC